MNVQTEHTSRFKAPTHAAVWFEIPVTDLERARKFYTRLLGLEPRLETTGPNPIAIFACSQDNQAVSGHLYVGKPAPAGTGPTIHLAVADDVAEALQRVAQSGGKQVSDIIEIPSGRFAYCLDPDGNSIGLFSQ